MSHWCSVDDSYPDTALGDGLVQRLVFGVARIHTSSDADSLTPAASCGCRWHWTDDRRPVGWDGAAPRRDHRVPPRRKPVLPQRNPPCRRLARQVWLALSSTPNRCRRSTGEAVASVKHADQPCWASIRGSRFGRSENVMIAVATRQAVPAMMKGVIHTTGMAAPCAASLKWPASNGPAMPAMP